MLTLERDGDVTKLAGKAVGVTLKAGDLLRITTQGGGGLGPVEDRDPDEVLRDVALGKISIANARDTYGMTSEQLEGLSR